MSLEAKRAAFTAKYEANLAQGMYERVAKMIAMNFESNADVRSRINKILTEKGCATFWFIVNSSEFECMEVRNELDFMIHEGLVTGDYEETMSKCEFALVA